MKGLGMRFWAECALAAASAALLVVTLFSRDWIEQVFHVDPDQGSGTLEWVIVAVALAITVTSVSLAGREWRRLHAATA